MSLCCQDSAYLIAKSPCKQAHSDFVYGVNWAFYCSWHPPIKDVNVYLFSSCDQTHAYTGWAAAYILVIRGSLPVQPCRDYATDMSAGLVTSTPTPTPHPILLPLAYRVSIAWHHKIEKSPSNSAMVLHMHTYSYTYVHTFVGTHTCISL